MTAPRGNITHRAGAHGLTLGLPGRTPQTEHAHFCSLRGRRPQSGR